MLPSRLIGKFMSRTFHATTEWNANRDQTQTYTLIVKSFLFKMDEIVGHFIKFSNTKSDECQNMYDTSVVVVVD